MSTDHAMPQQEIEISGQDLTVAQVQAVSVGNTLPKLTSDPSVNARMVNAAKFVEQAVADGRRVYGVTTGFGSMANVPVSAAAAAESQANLLAFLSTSIGKPLDARHTRAAMLLRANMLLRGVSGVRLLIVQRLIQFLRANATPVVGDLGSIGASGDLVPLAVIARAITGQGADTKVVHGDRCLSGRATLESLELQPLELLPKEALAMVNGTSFSAGIAANCVHATTDLFAISLAANAMMIRGLCGHEEPFLPFVHDCKPHPGQAWVASEVFRLLSHGTEDRGDTAPADSQQVQDRYSLRCLPQYLGSIAEGIARVTQIITIEMNSVTDNPLIDSDAERFYQSGNFLGQYIGLAMDDLRRFIGLLAKHLDVQIAQLVAPEFSHGLPASLQGNDGIAHNMGLKGLQITGNSIMPLLTHLGNPLVEHFPTHAEQFNQNINGLSWGAANLAIQSVDLFTHYCSLALIFAVQAVDMRAYQSGGHYDGRCLLSRMVIPVYESVYAAVQRQPGELRPLVFNDADQSLESYMNRLSDCIRQEGDLVAAVAPIVKSHCDASLAN